MSRKPRWKTILCRFDFFLQHDYKKGLFLDPFPEILFEILFLKNCCADDDDDDDVDDDDERGSVFRALR